MATSPSRDLSHAGVGFHLLSAANGAFGAGDVLRVQFKLFPNASLLVKKEAVFRQISNRRVNATFREPLKNEDDFLLKLFFYTGTTGCGSFQPPAASACLRPPPTFRIVPGQLLRERKGSWSRAFGGAGRGRLSGRVDARSCNPTLRRFAGVGYFALGDTTSTSTRRLSLWSKGALTPVVGFSAPNPVA